MKFDEETFNQVTVFHLDGKLMGGSESEGLCARLKELVATGMKMSVMDFCKVHWINSHGVGMIIACLTTLRGNGGDIRFANLHGMTERYFQITKLNTVVKIFGGVEEAVASFASR